MDFDNFKIFGAIVIVILLVGMLVFNLVNAFHTERGVQFTITRLERITDNKKGKYLIYNNNTTYELTDSWIHWRFDSSDVYGQLVAGKTYKADLQGFRIPFFSMYPNILNPVEVTKEK